MNIIVVGCGEVGAVLTERLSEEGYNLTVIDPSTEKIKALTNRLDVMGVVGNGASHTTLSEAGVASADLLIAVTSSDELNLLCCIIAKKASNCRTIARVRSHQYSSEASYLKDELGLAMVINPERASAEEISRVLRFPSAINVETFAKGRVELLRFRLPEDSRLAGLSVKEAAMKYKSDVLFCTAEREDEAFIVKGDFVFAPKDIISIVATPRSAATFFKKIGHRTDAVKSVLIAGGNEISHYLCSILEPTGVDIKLVEPNREVCEKLSAEFPSSTVICGDTSDQELLREEGIAFREAFIALTESDEENILLSLWGSGETGGKVITKIKRIEYTDIIERLSLDTVIYPKHVVTDSIIRYVRATVNTRGSNMESLYHVIKDQVEAAEFIIREPSAIVGSPLYELKLKPDVLIAAILRDGQVKIPRGSDTVEVGDTVILVTREIGLSDITDALLS